MKKIRVFMVVLCVFAFVSMLFVSEIEARGRRGGGGGRARASSSRRAPSRSFSRSGVASRGSFSSSRRTYSPSRRNYSSSRSSYSPSRRNYSSSRKTYSPRTYNRTNRQAQGSNRRVTTGQYGNRTALQNRQVNKGTYKGVNRQNLRDRQTTRYQDRQARFDEARRGDRAAPGQSKRQQAQEKWKDRQEDRQEWRDKNREDWQQHIKDRQEDRQDFIEDIHDDYWDSRYGWHGYYPGGSFAAGMVVGGAVVGTAAAAASTTSYVTTLPCSARVVTVSGVHYYSCGSTWYRRSYVGSQVTYIIVEPPPGY